MKYLRCLFISSLLLVLTSGCEATQKTSNSSSSTTNASLYKTSIHYESTEQKTIVETTSIDVPTYEKPTEPETVEDATSIDILNGHHWGETPNQTKAIGYATDFLTLPILKDETSNPRIEYNYNSSDELMQIELYLNSGNSTDWDTVYNNLCSLYGEPYSEKFIDDNHQKVEWFGQNGDAIKIIEEDNVIYFEESDLYLNTSEMHIVISNDLY